MGANQLMNTRYLVMVTEGATPGSYVAPATAQHIIRIREPKWSPDIPLDNESEKFANGCHAEDLSLPGPQSGKISFSVRCNVGASNVTAPQWWTPALGCGCIATSAYSTDKGIGLVRRLAQDDTTYSICIYDVEIGGGTPLTTLYKFAGCVGNMKIGCEDIGKPWIAQFEFSGKLVDIVDGTAVVLSSPGSVVPQTWLSHTASIATYAKNMPSWMFDLGNVVTPVPLQSDATGISHYVITKSSPRFSCNVLGVKQATTGADYLGNLLSKPANNTIQIGTAATGKLSLKVFDAQQLAIPQSDKGGLVSWDLNFKALSNGLPGALIEAAPMTYEDTFELLSGTKV